MKKIALSGLLGLMLVLSCGREKPSEPEITEPITITSPKQNAFVSDTVTVTTMVGTDYSFSRVDFYIDGDSVYSDPTYPFSYLWDTSIYSDSSQHQLKAIAHDSTTSYESNTVTVTVIRAVTNQFEYVSTFTTAGPAVRVASEGDYLYIAAGSEGIYGIDVSSPQSPDWLFTFDTPGQALGIDVDLPYIFLADGDIGVRRFNNAVPDTIIPAGYYDTPGLSRNVKVSENILLVADNDALQIISIDGDTLNPQFRLSITGGLVIDVDAIGETAYVLDFNGITVVDVSEPTSPDILSRYDFEALTGQGQSVCAIDSFVFVGTTAELMKLSAANLSQLRSLYRLGNEAGFTGVFATNSVLYASLGGSNGGAFAFEYRSGNSLVFLDQHINNDNCHDICATGTFIFLAGQTKVDILRFIK